MNHDNLIERLHKANCTYGWVNRLLDDAEQALHELTKPVDDAEVREVIAECSDLGAASGVHLIERLARELQELTKPVDDEEIKGAIATCEHWRVPKAAEVIERLARQKNEYRYEERLSNEIVADQMTEIERLKDMVTPAGAMKKLDQYLEKLREQKAEIDRLQEESVASDAVNRMLVQERDQLQAAIDRLDIRTDREYHWRELYSMIRRARLDAGLSPETNRRVSEGT